MKFVGLAIFLMSIPAFFALLQGPHRRWAWFGLGIGPFVIGKLDLDVAIISWATWPGYVKGMLVSLLDSLALATIFVTREPMRGRPLLAPFLIFFAGSSVSLLFTSEFQPSFFFAWQLARTVLLFVAVSMVAARPAGTKWIIYGLAAGVAVQAFYSLQQRFLENMYQASGTMGHQNLLGMSCHFAVMLSFAAMLAGDRRWLPKLGVVGGLIAVVLTGSRATTGLAFGGLVTLLVLSMVRRTTALKSRVAGLVVVAMLAAAPVAYETLQTRFTYSPVGEEGEIERQAFERAARAIWSDHPMGIGANRYVVVANADGYSERAGVIWNWTSRSANVHNTYLLIGAEMGYPGFLTFVALLLLSIAKGLQLAWARPRGPEGEIALGAAVALATVALHLFYEWVFVTWIVQYLFAIALGLIAGIDKQQRVVARERRNARRLRDEPAELAPPQPVPA